jgi:P pilus assembly chaperone PapD
MKKITAAIACALVGLVVAAPVLAQQTQTANVAGKWEMTNQTPRGTQTSTFTFAQDGTVLTGTVETPRGSTPISAGSVEGNTVKFTIVRTMGERTMETHYSGTVDGDTITGTMTTPRGEMEFTMRRVQG